jgi:hypothetical protein
LKALLAHQIFYFGLTFRVLLVHILKGWNHHKLDDKNLTGVTIKNQKISAFSLNYRPRPFQRSQKCEDWSLGTWRYEVSDIYFLISLKSKLLLLFTMVAIQGNSPLFHSKKLVANYTTATLQKSTESKILLILIFNWSIFQKSNSRENRKSWVRISVGPNNYFSEKMY